MVLVVSQATKAERMRGQRAEEERDKKRERDRMRELNECRSKKRRVDAAVRQREAFLASVTASLIVFINTVIEQHLRMKDEAFAVRAIKSRRRRTVWLLRTPGLTKKDLRAVPMESRPVHCFLGWSANPKPTYDNRL